MGEKDSFVQSQLAVISSKQVRDGRCAIIAGAGHVPFLSHPDLFMTELMHVLSE
jgi:hypothetical protein